MNAENELKIYRPIRSNKMAQSFGENKACAEIKFDGSLSGKVASKFTNGACPLGYRELYPLVGLDGHDGQDNAIWHGEPVFHCANFEGWMNPENDLNGGVGVDIISYKPILYCEDCKENHHIKMRYWHGLSVVGEFKRMVSPGDIIMFGDSTGLSSKDHVHWAVKWCDPNGVAIHQYNGYRGAFNHAPYYENIFAGEKFDIKYRFTFSQNIRALFFNLGL